VIDLHSHLLPGIDDGSRSVEQSVEVLTRFAEAGVTDLAVTPHLRVSDVPDRGEATIERRDRLLEELRRHAPEGLTLHPGFEIMLDAPLDAGVLDDRRFSLAGTRYYLVEFSTSVGGAPASAAIGDFQQARVTPLVAHPERYMACTIREFRSWVSLGAVLQVDATTITRPTSRGDMARQLVQEGLAHLMAADNHGDKRSLHTGRQYLEERGAAEIARRLTIENPRAILENRDVVPVGPARLKFGLRERLRKWAKDVRGR
jgi:protein-tyrosine phosphatase